MIVSRKKKAAAEQLQQVREELCHTEAECEEKRNRLQQAGSGGEVLKGDEVFNDDTSWSCSLFYQHVVNCDMFRIFRR